MLQEPTFEPWFNFASMTAPQLKALAERTGLKIDRYHGKAPLKADYLYYVERHFGRDGPEHSQDYLHPSFNIANCTIAQIRQILTYYGYRYFDSGQPVADSRLAPLQKLFADKVDEMREKRGWVPPSTSNVDLLNDIDDMTSGLNDFDVKDYSPEPPVFTTRTPHTPPRSTPGSGLTSAQGSQSRRDNASFDHPSMRDVSLDPPAFVTPPRSTAPSMAWPKNPSPAPASGSSDIPRSAPETYSRPQIQYPTLQPKNFNASPRRPARLDKLESKLRRNVQSAIEQVHIGNVHRAVCVLMNLREDLDEELLHCTITGSLSRPLAVAAVQCLSSRRKQRLCDALQNFVDVGQVAVREGRFADAMEECARAEEELMQEL